MSVPQATAPRRAPLRWAIALLATVALLVSGSGLVAFAQSGAGASRSAEWTPAGTPILVIARTDLPGGQEEALAQAMTAFPGFADPASFRMKLDEALDALVGDATNGALTWTGEIQSFFSGEIGLALPNLMEAALAGADQPDILLGMAIDDRAAAESFFDLLTAGVSDTLDAEPYGGTTILSDGDVAVAITDDWVLISQTPELLKQGVDTLNGDSPSLATSERYAAAAARVPDGHLAQVYMDLSSFGDLLSLGLAATGTPGAEALIGQMVDQLPVDMIAYLAAGPSTMTIEAFITPGPSTPAVNVGQSDLASGFPATTQVYIETRDLGTGIQLAIEQALALVPPEQVEAQLGPIEQILGTGPAEFLDFLGDTSIGASLADNALWVGIVGEVDDEATAATRLERVLSLVRIMGASEEAGISIEDEDVAGVSVTTITLPVEEIAGQMPLPFDVGDSISVAVGNGRLYVGSSDFVATSLELGQVDSLALAPGYVDAVGADTMNSGVMYANLGDIIMTLDPFLSLLVPEWAEVSPWVSGLDRLVAVGGGDEEVISSRLTLHVESQ